MRKKNDESLCKNRFFKGSFLLKTLQLLGTAMNMYICMCVHTYIFIKYIRVNL